MLECIAHLKSMTPYSQSGFLKSEYGVEKTNEKRDEFEQRVWRERMHLNDSGNVVIPSMAMTKCVQESAAYLSEKIAGKGAKTFREKFLSGVMCPEPIDTGVHKDKVKHEAIMCAAGGEKKNVSKRVERIYPYIESWEAKVRFVILDEVIDKDTFESHLIASGKFIGIGRWRAANGGMYGRFQVIKVTWTN